MCKGYITKLFLGTALPHLMFIFNYPLFSAVQQEAQDRGQESYRVTTAAHEIRPDVDMICNDVQIICCVGKWLPNFRHCDRANRIT